MKQNPTPTLAALGLIAGLALAATPDARAQSQTLIPLNATWSYLDTGIDPLPSWTGAGFDDSAWKTGAAELGYGDGDEATTVSFGPDANNKFITTWFRKTISVANPAAFSALTMTLTHDDGAVVYVNGAEVFRVNLPDGPIVSSSLGLTANDQGVANSTIPVGTLQAGNNVIAVEMHQANATSSDISFALELVATVDNQAPTLQFIAPAPTSVVQSLNAIELLFSEPVQGVDPGDLLINGQPATNIIFGVPGQFVFSFPPPSPGSVTVSFAANHGITDLAAVPNAFVATTWSYTVDPNSQPATFLITEFMAQNTQTLNDNYGNQSDWIEIHNPGQAAGNLLGWYLTDDTNNLTKWRFPSRTIDPGQYIVVFASGRNETNNAAFLHTSFQLNNTGEFLALVDPNTNIVSAFSPVYPPQTADVSYGRDRANPNITGYFSTPTPRAANATSGDGISPEVTFSRDNGTFPTNRPFALTLSTPGVDAAIFYAFGTNVPGSNVSANVFRYTGPIQVTNTMAIRARAFAPGQLPGPIVSKAYFALTTQTNVVGFASELPIMVIHNFGQGTFPADSTITGERWVYVQTFENDCGVASMTNKPTATSRGIMHTRGSSTQTASTGKASFFLETRDEFDQDRAVPLLGLPAESDWVLYAPNGFEPALFHNPLAHQLARDGGEYASRYRFVEVFLKDDTGTPGPIASGTFAAATSGDYYGVFVLEEKIKRDKNRVDIEKLEPEHVNYPEITGGYLFSIDRTDSGKGTLSVTGGSLNPLEPGWTDWTNAVRAPQRSYIQSYFNAFAAGLNGANLTNATLAGGAPNTNHYSSYINPESWVRRHIHEVLTFNVDALRLSGYLFKDRNKRIEYGPAWDYDRTQGSTDGRDANPRTWRSTAGDLGTDFFNFTPWWGTLLRAPDFWQLWIDRYQSERQPGGSLSTANILGRIDGFYNLLKDAQPRERLRWNVTTRGTNGSGTGTYLDEVTWKKHWYQSRLNFMDTNFLNMPVIGSLGGSVAVGTKVQIIPAGKAGTSIIYTLDGTDPRLPNGFISPAALSNNGPVEITITRNVRIVARSYNPAHRNLTGQNNPPISSPWSGPRSLTLYTETPALRITELMYHPAAPATGTTDADEFEFIEVRNTGATPLNVNRFRLRGGVDFDFPNATLAAGEYAVIVRNAAAFTSRYGLPPRILGVYTNDSLANDGEHLVLQGAVHEPILEFSYSDQWYPTTDGAGFSLVIRNDSLPASTWDTKAGWRPSGVLNGTPGAADPGEIAIANVVINEILTHTDPLPGDAVELYNPTTSPVDVGHWYLTDDFGTPKKYRFPAGTIIPANGYVVFYQSNSFGLGASGFAFGAKGDEAYLFSADADGALTGYVHGWDFGAQSLGVTFGRHVNSVGSEQLPTQSSPTLGADNSGPLVGPIVISEVNYHPVDLVLGRGPVDNCIDEYIELHNNSDAPVALFSTTNGWRLRDAVEFTFPLGTTIAPNGFVLVVPIDPADPGQANAFRARNSVPPEIPLFGPYSGQLDNDSDSIELVRPDVPDTNSVPYVLVDKVRYTDSTPWPAAADGIGPTLQRRNLATYGNDAGNWVAAAKTAGTAFGGGTGPTITQQPANSTVLATLTASFSVVASGPGPFSYQWRFNGTPIPGATSSILALPAVTSAQAGQYSVVVLNASGAVISDDATLTVLIPASIVSHPQSVFVRIKPDAQAAPTTNVSFAVGATTFNPPLSYQWRFNGADIAGATASSYTVVNVTTNDYGAFSCAVSDSVGTIFSSNAVLYPVIQMGILVNPASTNFVAPGSLVGLSCVVTGFPPPFYFQWRRGSTPLATVASMSPANVFTFFATNTPGLNFQYRAVVTNAFPPFVSPGFASTFANVTTGTDTDGDKMLDQVEDATPGLDKNNAADAASDLDGDGLSNGNEVAAGTDPRDPNSFLRVTPAGAPGTFQVQFNAKANQTYVVEYTDSIASGLWIRFSDVNSTAADRAVTLTDPTGNANRFYRLVTPGPRP